MNFIKHTILALLVTISCQTFAQDSLQNTKGKFGFLFKANFNYFQLDEPTVEIKSDCGWGLGYLYAKNFTKLIGVDIETQLNFEKHTLTDKASNISLKLKEINFAIPLKLRFKLYKNLFVLTGGEYLRVLSKQTEQLNLKKDNYQALAGTSYTFKFKNFTAVPEITYRLGLNNALENMPSHYQTLQRASVVFTIKIMSL